MTIGAAISVPTATTLTLNGTVVFSSTITMPVGSPNLIVAAGAAVTTTGLLFTANTAGGAQLVTMQGDGNFSPAAITMPVTNSTGTAKITCASLAAGTLSVSGLTSITGGNAAGTSSIDFGTVATACKFTTGTLTLAGGSVGNASLIMGSGALTINGAVTFGTAGNILRSIFTTGASAITLANCAFGANGTLSIASATVSVSGTSSIDGAYTFPTLSVTGGTTSVHFASVVDSLNGDNWNWGLEK